MEASRSKKISNTVLIVSCVLLIAVVLAFVCGGQVPESQRLVPGAKQPRFTDCLLYLCDVMLVVTLVVWIVSGIVGFARGVKANKDWSGLIALIILVVMCMIIYGASSGKTLIMPGYEGKDNTRHFSKLTDMWLISSYIMLGLTVLAMIFMPMCKKRKFK